jgi:hypothetical protein
MGGEHGDVEGTSTYVVQMVAIGFLFEDITVHLEFLKSRQYQLYC